MIGIKSAVVALLAQKAEVNYDQSVTNIINIVKHVTDLGYHATVLEDNAQGFSVIELAVSYELSICFLSLSDKEPFFFLIHDNLIT